MSTRRDHRLAHRLWRNLIRVGAVGALGGLALTVDNARRIRVPDATLPCEPEPLWVLLPVRDEAADVTDCVRSLQSAAARWPGPSRIVVLDDESTDATPDLLAQLSADDDGLVVLRGEPRPDGWLGKPWACAQLTAFAAADTDPDRAPGGVLVFVDADVRLAADALVATVATMRAAHLDLFCPYPLQETNGAAERLVQPLLQWSWMSTLPLGLAERSPRPSLSAANGQFLAVDKNVYERAGGHRAVRADVLEDIGLLRAVKNAGGRGVVGEGSAVANCRMYDGWEQVRAGYRKSLWAAFGSPSGAVAVMTFLIVSYVAPAAAALGGSRIGLVGYLAGVASRVVTARRTGGHAWPDALLHPVSVLALATLTADSIVGHRRGALRWKGRPVHA